MQFKKIVEESCNLVAVEFKKCIDKSTLIISIIYFLLISATTLFDSILKNVFAKSNINLHSVFASTIEEALYQSVFSKGIFIFAILIIVTFGNELSQSTFKKSLLTGYSRFSLFIGSFVRINILIIFFLLITLFAFLFFHFYYNTDQHDSYLTYRIIAIYLAFLFIGLAALSILLLLGRIYLSILILTILIIASYTLFVANQIIINTNLIVFIPFVSLKYLSEPFRIFGDNYFFISFFTYLALFSTVSFMIIQRKRFF